MLHLVSLPSSLFSACVVGAFLLGAGTAQTNRVLYTMSGDAAGDALGEAVSGCGDLDGDGLADVVVGGPWSDAGGTDSGKVSLVGRGGRVIATLVGANPGDLFGFAVAGLGDVDGDGVEDLIVGAPGANPRGVHSGRTQVLSGRTRSVLYTIDGDAAGDECGYAVGSAADIDRDGRADFIVGFHLADAPRPDTGIARVYSGRDGSVLRDLRGVAEGDHFGAWVGEVGDVNADGFPDFIVTAPWADVGFLKSGSATVYSGADGSVLHLLHGQGAGHEFGTAFAKIGDVDGDGHADLFIAEPEHKLNGDDAGAVRLFSGRTGAQLLILHGSHPYEYFGLTIGGGDFDADGVPDLVVGAFLEDTGAPNGGTVYVYSGATFARIFAAHGSAHSDQLGRGVAFAGDLDGDGIGDIIAGVPGLDTGAGIDSGGLRAYCGMPSAPATYTFGTGCPASRPFSLSFSGSSQVGQVLHFDLAQGPTAVPLAWIVLALRDQPPLDLSAAGMPGCTLYQPLEILIPIALASGAGSLPLPIPPLSGACGLQLFSQGLGWEPGINPLGVITSNGGRVVVSP
ncbi:MAG: integrin alpha [Planctomycetota bacterium]